VQPGQKRCTRRKVGRDGQGSRLASPDTYRFFPGRIVAGLGHYNLINLLLERAFLVFVLIRVALALQPL